MRPGISVRRQLFHNFPDPDIVSVGRAPAGPLEDALEGAHEAVAADLADHPRGPIVVRPDGPRGGWYPPPPPCGSTSFVTCDSLSTRQGGSNGDTVFCV